MAAIPLNALRTFEAVASRLSFSKGAEALHVTPAAVSSQVRSLEEKLNVKLFHRQGRNITLTAAGRQLLPGVQRGLNEMAQAVRLLEQGRSEGVLNLSLVPSFMQRWLAPRLADFYQTHPEIDLRISGTNAAGRVAGGDRILPRRPCRPQSCRVDFSGLPDRRAVGVANGSRTS
jgi:LysR family glycine cleavage system transcriptional activator